MSNKLKSNKRKGVAIGISVLIAILFTIGIIYGIEDYGIAVFILIPLVLGVMPTTIYGQKFSLTKLSSFTIGLISLAIYTLCLIIFAIEGLICIVMALPIGIFFVGIGSLIGYYIVRKAPDKSTTMLIFLFCLVPLTSFVEKNSTPTITSIVTKIEINADIQTVWNNVIEFPQLNEPDEFIFKTGIAYPINAKIENNGVGAIRYCNFTTGSFVEPITVWDEPYLLKFDVLEQPAPLKELSFWDIDAPHLHDYFVSKQGQFRLYKIDNGNTMLEGTTWYYHKIKPEFYWKIWSSKIVHKIHLRVLKHIKYNSERTN